MKKYVQSPQRRGKRKKGAKNTLSGKVMLQKGEKNKIFPRQQKVKEFVTTGSALEEMLKGVLHTEIKTLISDLKTYEIIKHIVKNKCGEGNGNPLQCSCLGNPMDKGVKGYSP